MGKNGLHRVNGPNLALRLIEPGDADYVHGLRMDPTYNQHLSEVRGTVEDQRRWIESYKAREAKGHEYYYVIERNDGRRCGVVRLYDIDAESFTWGSWILDHNKPPKAALESAVLSFGIGFDTLGKSKALVDVRRQNERAHAFYLRFGMNQVDADELNIYFTYSRVRYEADRETHLSVVSGLSGEDDV